MPARLSKIIQAAAEFGIEIEKPKRGSHWKARRPGYRSFPIPAHNGKKTEISDRYIKGFCSCLGLDLEEFRKHL